MKDITKEIKDAINQDVLWSIGLFFDFIEKLKYEKVEVSYWENEENWATLIFDEKVVGYLWKKYPVLFLLSDYSGKISSIVKNCNYLSLILVNDLDSNVLKLDLIDLKDYFEYGLDYSKFSATDLWFQTNSI